MQFEFCKITNAREKYVSQHKNNFKETLVAIYAVFSVKLQI